jgi:hypothetical protein
MPSSSSISSSSSSERRSVRVYTREHDPVTGEITGPDISSVFWGEVALGQKSALKVVTMRAEGASRIANVKVGITRADTGNYSVKDVFYVAHVADISQVVEPTAAFQGINSAETRDNPYNFSVGTRESADGKTVESDYVVLMAKSQQRLFKTGACTLRWFFDFDYE